MSSKRFIITRVELPEMPGRIIVAARAPAMKMLMGTRRKGGQPGAGLPKINQATASGRPQDQGPWPQPHHPAISEEIARTGGDHIPGRGQQQSRWLTSRRPPLSHRRGRRRRRRDGAVGLQAKAGKIIDELLIESEDQDYRSGA